MRACIRFFRPFFFLFMTCVDKIIRKKNCGTNRREQTTKTEKKKTTEIWIMWNKRNKWKCEHNFSSLQEDAHTHVILHVLTISRKWALSLSLVNTYSLFAGDDHDDDDGDGHNDHSGLASHFVVRVCVCVLLSSLVFNQICIHELAFN